MGECWTSSLPFLDFLHTPEPLPSVKKNTASCCGATLSIFFFIAYIVYEIIIFRNYDNDFKLTYSQDFQQTNIDTGRKITFGFKLVNSNDFNDPFELHAFDSEGKKIDDNLIKKCDPFLREVKENSNLTDNYYCFIDYPINGSKIVNHIFEVRIINRGEIQENINNLILSMRFKEPILKHNNDNPFDYSEINDLVYFLDIKSTTSYRKYIKLIDYKTYGFFSSEEKKSAYLDDFEDIDKSDRNNGHIFGSFKLSISKKKDVFERKYVGWLDYFVDKIIGKFVSVHAIFKLLALILVNPIDNLRIFTSLNKQKPSLFNDSKKVIDYYYCKKNRIPIENNNIITKKEFDCCDKVKLFFRCCRKDEKREIIAVNDFIEEKLTIANTLENSIIDNIKYNMIRDRIRTIPVPNQHRDTEDREFNYLEEQLRGEFPNYEAEEIKIMIKEIIKEKNKGQANPQG